jgi:uncharacterized ferredoxin-like protein
VNSAVYGAKKILMRMESLYENGDRDKLFPNTISYSSTAILAYVRTSEVGSKQCADCKLKQMNKFSQIQ